MDTEFISKQTEFALASYANLTIGTPDVEALQDQGRGMSAPQASRFASLYSVVTQFNDTGTSFSATVFKDTSGSLTLAIRGTLEPGDFFPTDTNIALHGAGYDQIVAMYNWWVRVTSPTGQMVQQYRIASAGAPFILESAPSVSGTGKLVEALASDADRRVEVTGHSLGAHLALAFNALFPNVTNRVTGFNTPGFIDSAGNRQFFATLGGAVPTAANSGNVTNVIADESNIGDKPWNAIAGLYSPPGTTVNISIENQWLSDEPNSADAKNHSQTILTDSLAVFNLFSRLAPTISTADYKAILGQAARGTSASYERIVDSVETLFGINRTSLPTGNSNRDALYAAIYGLQSNTEFGAVAGQVRITPIGTGLTAPQIASIAGSPSEDNTDQAFRYALKELIPFAVIDPSTLYTPHNTTGELNLYDGAAGVGMTRQYLDDRAEMLTWKNTDFAADGQRTLRSKKPLTYDFVDKTLKDTSGNDLTFKVVGRQESAVNSPVKVIFGGELGETIVGGNVFIGDHLFGGGGIDTIVGNDGNDYLEGNADADTLQGGIDNDVLLGGAGDDRLEGGTDFDTYLVGAGHDTIVDTDGRGVVKDASGRVIQGTFVKQGSQYVWVAGSTVTATRNSPLTITLADGASVTIDGFVDGNLGIVLADTQGADEASTNVVNGTDFNDDNSFQGGQPHTALVGDPGGVATADEIHGFLGNDILDGRDGEDRLFGDEGRDILFGGLSDDTLQGGIDGDILLGVDGHDVIVAEGLVNDDLFDSMDASIDSDATPPGLVKEFLGGGGGNDILVGGTGNDVLSGGLEIDTLIGGAGNDTIWGDAELVATSLDWSVDGGFVNVSGVVPPAGVGSTDSIYGGGGDDLILAEAGDDYVDAGAGADRVIGHDGHDTLFGGAGNDIIAGDTAVGDAAHVIAESLHGDDYLDGEDGDDELTGNGGADTIFGGTGNDKLFGDDNTVSLAFQGDDYLDGEAGDDQLFGFGGADTIFSGDGNDIAFGDLGDDYLDGEAGADQLSGGEGADTLFGGAGMDLLLGDAGDDYLDGEDDADQIAAGAGNDIAFGGAGNDIFTGGAGDDLLDGEDGNDVIAAGAGADTLFGGLGIDQLQGGSGNDLLDGGDDADFLFGDADDAGPGNYGADTITGGAGNDQIVGSGGADILSGGDGDDQIFGDGDEVATAEQAADFISGGLGNDIIRGYGGDDQIFGDDGSDTLYGEAGADTIDGGSGNDFLFGDRDVAAADDGNDTLSGGGGNDQLVGYGGADTLAGGTDADTLSGDAGNDTYLFARGDGQDLVFDQDATAGNLDRVRFAAGITPDDVTATRGPVFANDLVLTLAGTTDALTIANQLSTNTAFRVEEIRFADGTVWGPNSTPMLIRGTAANNVLTGTAGPDVFEGLAGNDTLNGGLGSDTYRFFRGDGQDTITDSDATLGNVDKVLYVANILPSEIQALRSGGNLVLRVTGTTDQVTVSNYFQNEGATSFSVEQIKFASDGTIWDLAMVKAKSLIGTAGNDTLIGYATDDVLSGLAGNDTLIGNAGNDTLDGGTGADSLQGGTGNDTYFFARGYGQDTVTDVDSTLGNVDTISFAADIFPSDVNASRSGDNLLLSINGTADQLTVSGYFVNDGASANAIERIQFANGTVWDFNTVKQLLLIGTEGADTILGYATDDLLDGRGGEDALFGGAGNDTLIGGPGRDTLRGEAGNDVLDGRGGPLPGSDDADLMVGGTGDDLYHFGRLSSTDQIYENLGSSVDGGFDTIEFDADITPADVTLDRSATITSLLLHVNGSGVQLWIDQYFANDGYNANSVEQIRFASDGTVWDIETVKQMVSTPTEGRDWLIGFSTNDVIFGLGGDDAIRGGGGDDTLDGGTGNDSLFGNGGSDTYLFNRGSGQDTVVNVEFDTPGTTDVLQFGAGILPSEIVASRVIAPFNDHLVLSVSGTTDQVTLYNYFFGGENIVEQIRFADGTVWTDSTIGALFPINGTAGNDTLQGTAIGDTINGFAGDDVIHGGAGNDTLDGGLGSDQLFGESGDDTLIGGNGDSARAGVFNELQGGFGHDVLIGGDTAFNNMHGGFGNDLYLSGAGSDAMFDASGRSLFHGRGGADSLSGADDNDLYIGGGGNDSINGDFNGNGLSGADIVLFNRADGADTVIRLGQATALSLGGMTGYSQLKLDRSGDALIVKLGKNNIAFSDWYSPSALGSRATYLQVMAETLRAYDPASTDPLVNQKVQVFDFQGLIAAWDQAQANRQRFVVADHLAEFRISGSDTQAYGGEAAYQYGTTGTLDALSFVQMQAVINAPEFGLQLQAISGGTSATSLAAFASLSDTVDTETAMLTQTVSTASLEPDLEQPVDNGALSSTGGSVVKTSAADETASASNGADDTLQRNLQAQISGWFDEAEYQQPYSLSVLDPAWAGAIGTGSAESDDFAVRNAAQWNRIARLLPQHLMRYADSGLDPDESALFGAFGNPLYGSGEPVTSAVGLPSVSGNSLKPFQGLKEGLSKLA